MRDAVSGVTLITPIVAAITTGVHTEDRTDRLRVAITSRKYECSKVSYLFLSELRGVGFRNTERESYSRSDRAARTEANAGFNASRE